ncbi:Dolichyl-diphosphooligosaccharide-protein glycosyltransferase 48kDa subunit [Metschnikowia bicuspidata]|uniref:Dolichyl-diphosphooligosaccharide--protein glycosyltransferase subunit WBP1 n=1 Tax=Metschnikowia bicuspidata TaxID=27322 RepID=A0A4V1J3K9_9ASCO|nr:Dolichyl-diphosphooligosaccharide-protein glycosyltransferase 48kDa subunit [Metschnikowia bicuspidata]
MLFLTFAKLAAFLALATLSVSTPKTCPKKTSVLVVYDLDLVQRPQDLVSTFRLDPERFNIGFLEYSNKDVFMVHDAKPLYEHVVFLPSLKKAPAAKGITNKHKILEYFNLGGNVLAVGSAEHSVPESVVLFLNEAGIYPAPKGYSLSSFFDKDLPLKNSNLVSKRILSLFDLPAYTGSAALVSNNELVLPILRAPSLSFTAPSDSKALTEDNTWTYGEQGFVAVAFQALNSARAAWVGSLDLATPELLSWVFQERKVLKLQFTKHHKTSEPAEENISLYRIKDEASYSVGVSELQNNVWVPYTPASKDDVLQLSFKMLDPYVRLNLTHVGAVASEKDGSVDTNVFAVNFTIPDHHGMFTFELDYMRECLSFLSDKRVVAVRHLANDEYKRSWDITNAWVYIISASAVVVAWLLFVANFLFLSDDVKKIEEKEKKE